MSADFPRMHVSLYVADLTATVNFYTAFFGQPATKLKPGYAKYVLASPALIISFVQNPERVRSSFGHLGFQVETPALLAERLAAARAAGLVQREETGTHCCYAKQDKFWVQDPDGTEWEVYYFHEDAEFNDPRYEADYQPTAAPSQCCPAPGATAAPALLPIAISLPDTLAGGPATVSCC